jgi:hypothetical protein
MNHLEIVALGALAGLWGLGSLLYLGMVWRDSLRDLFTQGRRLVPVMDLVVIVTWPLLLLIESMLPIIRTFKQARDY